MSLLWEHDFSEADKKAIAAAIAAAEAGTSGEIRVYFEQDTGGHPPLDRAREAFLYLKMHETARRNGVLFYIAFEDHKFAILGDEGIHHQVGQAFWDGMKVLLAEHFSREAFVEGLEKAIAIVGRKLAEHFPREGANPNELPDEPYFKNESPR